MPGPRPPRLMLCALLMLPALICWLGSAQTRPLLGRHISWRLNLQVAHGAIAFGTMPNPEKLDAWDAGATERVQLERKYITIHFQPPMDFGHEFLIHVSCQEAWRRGFVTVAFGSRRHTAVALWLAGIPLSLLTIPFLNALRLVRRRTRWLREMRCIACGYSLRGLYEPRCPECGLAFATPRRRGVCRAVRPRISAAFSVFLAARRRGLR